MFLDLHVHSQRSDDAGATVEGYLRWIGTLRRKGYQVDGIVLTEHRGFDLEADYSVLSARYDVLVLKGLEIETDLGHILVYGVTPKLLEQFDFSSLDLPAQAVLRAVRETGAYAVAAHPGRRRIGLGEHLQRGADIAGIQTVEMLNGGTVGQDPVLQQVAMDAHISEVLLKRTNWMYHKRMDVQHEGATANVYGREYSLRNATRLREVYGLSALLGTQDPLAPQGGAQEVNQRSRAGQNHGRRHHQHHEGDPGPAHRHQPNPGAGGGHPRYRRQDRRLDPVFFDERRTGLHVEALSYVFRIVKGATAQGRASCNSLWSHSPFQTFGSLT
ncbi:MAG: hypothetical protein EXR55_05625 [Dehalococcoidia bacterium]|nr:hypothetical protein [Dehalococcoidia bacterium]